MNTSVQIENRFRVYVPQGSAAGADALAWVKKNYLHVRSVPPEQGNIVLSWASGWGIYSSFPDHVVAMINSLRMNDPDVNLARNGLWFGYYPMQKFIGVRMGSQILDWHFSLDKPAPTEMRKFLLWILPGLGVSRQRISYVCGVNMDNIRYSATPHGHSKIVYAGGEIRLVVENDEFVLAQDTVRVLCGPMAALLSEIVHVVGLRLDDKGWLWNETWSTPADLCHGWEAQEWASGGVKVAARPEHLRWIAENLGETMSPAPDGHGIIYVHYPTDVVSTMSIGAMMAYLRVFETPGKQERNEILFDYDPASGMVIGRNAAGQAVVLHSLRNEPNRELLPLWAVIFPQIGVSRSFLGSGSFWPGRGVLRIEVNIEKRCAEAYVGNNLVKTFPFNEAVAKPWRPILDSAMRRDHVLFHNGRIIVD